MSDTDDADRFRLPERVAGLTDNERALIRFWRQEMGGDDPAPDLALVHALRLWRIALRHER